MREEILTAQLPPGTPLRLRELAHRLGMSVIPVREALHRLHQEGLVTRGAQKGAVVAPLSVQDMEDLYRVRIELEGLAIQLACQRFTEEHHRRLSRLLDEFVQELSRRLREVAGYQVEPWKPLVGENLFRRETGAVAMQFHVPEAIEPYAAEVVGAKRRLVLGKKSGLASIRIKCEELGLQVPEEAQGDLLARVKELSIRKRGLVSDEEFRALAAGYSKSL